MLCSCKEHASGASRILLGHIKLVLLWPACDELRFTKHLEQLHASKAPIIDIHQLRVTLYDAAAKMQEHPEYCFGGKK